MDYICDAMICCKHNSKGYILQSIDFYDFLKYQNTTKMSNMANYDFASIVMVLGPK